RRPWLRHGRTPARWRNPAHGGRGASRPPRDDHRRSGLMAEAPQQVTGGVTTWAQAVAGPLAEATCLWQDLDGLHVAPAPADPPPTSILWGWTDDGILLR